MGDVLQHLRQAGMKIIRWDVPEVKVVQVECREARAATDEPDQLARADPVPHVAFRSAVHPRRSSRRIDCCLSFQSGDPLETLAGGVSCLGIHGTVPHPHERVAAEPGHLISEARVHLISPGLNSWIARR